MRDQKPQMDWQSSKQAPPRPTPDTSKPSSVYQPTKGRSHTLSVALPGSIIANAQSAELKSILAGQIARALAVFCVDEVVIFNDSSSSSGTAQSDGFHGNDGSHGNDGADRRYSGYSDPNRFLAHLLSYLETPPHLRKALFELHPNLRTAGQLPSLDMPHHLRSTEWCRWREGVVVEGREIERFDARGNARPDGRYAGHHGGHGGYGGSAGSTGSTGSAGQTWRPAVAPQVSGFADVGFARPVILAEPAPVGSRVTVRFDSAQQPPRDPRTAQLSATAVAPSDPRETAGYYWGYSVRSAASLSAVFTECAFPGGYDLSVGTSERGVPLDRLGSASAAVTMALATYRHLVVFFGGVAGLEKAVAADGELAERGIGEKDAGSCFDAWLNLCPGQGSRTIRTEEAVWLGLMGLRDCVVRRGEKD